MKHFVKLFRDIELGEPYTNPPMPNELDENTRKRIEAEAEKKCPYNKYYCRPSFDYDGYIKGATAEALHSKKLVDALGNILDFSLYDQTRTGGLHEDEVEPCKSKELAAALNKAEQALKEYNKP